MGSVFRPKDFRSEYKTMIDNSLKDLSSEAKEDILKLLNKWEGASSEEKLVKIIGPERMEKLLNEVQKNMNTLNENEKNDLKNIFKDSLTFD